MEVMYCDCIHYTIISLRIAMSILLIMQHFYDKYCSKIKDGLQKFDDEFKDRLEEKVYQLQQVSMQLHNNNCGNSSSYSSPIRGSVGMPILFKPLMYCCSSKKKLII